MDPLKFKYGLDEVPPFGELIFRFAVAGHHDSDRCYFGSLVAGLHFSELSEQIIYIQKVFLLWDFSLVQLLWGHRLPLVGPATILLVGIVASREAGRRHLYCYGFRGLVLFLLSAVGLFNRLKIFHTSGCSYYFDHDRFYPYTHDFGFIHLQLPRILLGQICFCPGFYSAFLW